MRYARKTALVLAATSAFALTGCISDKAAREIAEGLASPFNSLATQLSGAQDLVYATGAFWRKNERWPKDYTELSAFVQASDGLLVLGQYDRVDFVEQPEGGLEVSSTVHSRTIRIPIPPLKPDQQR